MKKRIAQLLLAFAIVLSAVPITAYAVGGYFTIKGEKVYHSAYCEKVKGKDISNITWYTTLKKVEKTGRKPCPLCAGKGVDYEPDESVVYHSKDEKIQKFLELEHLEGVLEGQESGYSEGYDKGYVKGYSKGYDEGNSSGYYDGYDAAEQALSPRISGLLFSLYCCILIFGVVLLIGGVVYTKRRNELEEKISTELKNIEDQKKAAKLQIDQEQHSVNEWKRNVLNKISEDEKTSLAQIKLQRELLEKDINLFQKNIKDTKQSNPALASQIADAQYYLDMGIFNQLVRKPRPALRAAEELKQIAGEKRTLLKENRQLQYQLDFYEKLFPWLEEFKEVPSDEAISYATGSYGSEYETIKKWISPEEYEKLSPAKKYQLALDRWKNRPKKTDWDVGIEYERFIGYKLECEGYKVSYTGATLGLNDMGRDLLATKAGKTLVIQCKRWAKEKTIHEKHIFQLYGSTAVLSTEHPETQYKPVFITTATLSDTARKCAEYCGIAVVENCPIGDYPLIKCNANKDGDKIYHLPFDQQYDKVVISKNKQSCYAWTTYEAEGLGFRRAYRWRPNKS